MHPRTVGDRIRFAEFEVDLGSGELFHQGRKLPLQEQPFQVLRILLERPGQLVTREELRSQLWPADTFVDFDHGLNKAVAKLREALAQANGNRPLIETLPRRGYRFIAPVIPVDAGPSPTTPAVPAITAEPTARKQWLFAWLGAACVVVLFAGVLLIRHQRAQYGEPERGAIAMAVLPFANLTGAPSNDALAEGLTQNLIRQCSEIPKLHVMTRAAVENVNPASATRQLGVSILLTGALRKDRDGSLVIDGEVSNARDGSVIRSRRYVTEHDDLQPVQADIIADLIDALGLQLDSRESANARRPLTSSRAAFEDFLRGEDAFRNATPGSTHAAINNFEAAVEKDPDFALAWSHLAEAHLFLGVYFEAPLLNMPLARKYAERALSIEVTMSSAHAALGLVDLLYDWNFSAAEKELSTLATRKVAIAQLGCTAHLLDRDGQVRQAKQDIQSSLEFDPRSGILTSELGCISYYARQNEDAIRNYRQALALDPQSPLPYWGLGKSLTREGRYGEALQVMRSFKTISGFEPPLITAEIGYALAASGDRRAAFGTIGQLKDASKHIWVDPYFMALIYHGLKNREQTYAWLDKAYLARSPFLISLPTEPKWDDARQDPKFGDLMRRMFETS
jgi:DNA-binding winged helix-turn-helix (wHTH) protein/TolB-like protein/Tfp pilus assembly protein PilF